MIITVTLNPAIDRILYVPSFKTGEVNRALKTIVDAGGKGINVSKAVKSLGGETIALGFAAGRHGRFIKDNLSSFGIEHHFVEVCGECRVNIKIYCMDKSHTDINEPGFDVSDANFNLLLGRLKGYLRTGNTVVISGSTPPNLSLELYTKLCQVVTEAKIPLIVDADDGRLLHSLEAHPTFVKMNSHELSDIMEKPVETFEDALPGARSLIDKGALGVLVSFLPNGVLCVTKDSSFYIDAPSVAIVNMIGAGDALVGGLAHALEQNMGTEAAVKYALSTSVASTLIESSSVASRRDILSIYEKVKLRTL